MAFPMQKHLTISYSSRNTLRSCDAKFNFAKMLNNPRRERSHYAEMGIALHTGFHHYLAYRDEDAAIWEYMKAHPIDLVSSRMDNYSLEGGLSTLLEMIHNVEFDTYEVAEIKDLNGKVRKAIEVPFEIRIKNFSLSDEFLYTVSFVGFIDAILWDVATERFCVLETKTTGSKVSDFTPRYHFDEQCTPYGLVLDYMRSGQVQNFTAKYLIAHVHALDRDAMVYDFPRSIEGVRDWYQGLMLDLFHIKTMLAMNWFPRSGGSRGSCMAYKRKCGYYEICAAEHDALHKDFLLEISGIDEIEPDHDLISKTAKPFEPWISFDFDTGDTSHG